MTDKEVSEAKSLQKPLSRHFYKLLETFAQSSYYSFYCYCGRTLSLGWNLYTCIICVLHFVPNGIKLRGHIGSELQRKAAGILSIETDDNPEYSVVKAIKVRDGSPLDVPMMLFGWDKEADMHVYRGEKSKEDKEKRKTDELIAVVKEAFRNKITLSYQELCEVLMREMEIKDRTAKKYIAYMKEQRILAQDSNGNYQKGELCHT